ncbi:arsenate reductase/protein-tyrosine-phosphatase family protein [Pseudoduganella namucuonensis]|uniref:protein-tyrosine-phosphatase n=1 Tax=Pseudoduganella namucuonensis TaxID=1035707 RepID=A0A1I7GEJ3_9BURK|nr:hypothetical protein [Pseudoduganella namucuonensis]SFU46741.1 Protein-tyrosine-phosphatase [Pseudoduganella namucuonensis]
MSGKDKVLVLGDDTRSFLTTVRSLGRKGIEVHVAPFDFNAPTLSSRHISAIHHLPYYLDGGAGWLEAITRLVRTQAFSLIIPCDERGLLPLCLHRDTLGALCSLAIPSPDPLEIFFDKVKTRQLAERCGVPVANGRMLQSDDTAGSIAASLNLPVVVKHPKSYALPELYVRTSTRIVPDQTSLEAWLANRVAGCEPILLEAMFPGFGIGVSVLCHEGTILQAFEHHRANELDGSSYYRKSAPLDPERLAAVGRMTAATAYTGLAMFEFKVDERSGAWILIEVNARPWGSLPLPVSIGVDFPYRLYRLMVHGERTPQVPYPIGHYGRNLVLDLWQARKRAATLPARPGQLLGHWAGWLWGFHRLLLGREHHDVGVWNDPRPGLRELGELVLTQMRSLKTRIRGPVAPTKALERRMQEISASPAETIRILFVCQGNINRSSYAEQKSRQIFATRSARYSFDSAGMLPRNRRPSPAVAISAATRHGVDLTAHLSRHATAELLSQAHLIIAFDHINLRSIAARYPELKGQVFLLGEAGDAGDQVEIPDPEGKSEATFLTTFQRIDASLERLARVAFSNQRNR